MNTDEDLPKALQPQFVLDVEKEELGINAGLQDRVVQTYEGVVFMDFHNDLLEGQVCVTSLCHVTVPRHCATSLCHVTHSDLLEGQGHGQYERLDVRLLPRLWLAYDAGV